jgi:predicted nucleic acid-binding protein
MTMTVILDTNVLSELRLPSPDPSVMAWFAVQAEADLAIASFSVAEVEYGIAVLPQRNAVLARMITAWLSAIMATHQVLALDGEAGRVLGRLHAVPALRHLAVASSQTRIPRLAGDLAIAATAVAHQASVATRNVPDFRLIAQHCPGLAGIDPWTGQVF